MAQRHRRLSAAAAVVATTAILAACGGDGGAGGGSETIKIGVLTALSGPSAVYGEEITQGAQLAVQELNEEGGVGGNEIELLTEDHANDPDDAVTAAQKVLSVDSASVVLTSFTAPSLAIRPLACEREVPMLNGGAIGADLINQECLYNTVANSVTMYPQLLEYAVEQYGAERVATIFWNDEAGNAINDEVAETCSSLGCEVVASESHDVGATDLSVQMARIKSAQPDLVVVGSWGDDLGYIVSDARNVGLTAPIVGNDYTDNALEIAGPDAMEGYVAILDRFDAEIDDPETQEFVAAFREEFDEDPTNFAANYYEHVKYIVAEAINRAVEADENPSDTGVIRAKIDEMISEGYEFPSLYGDAMVLNDDGTVDKPVAIYQVEGGQLVRLDEASSSGS